MKNGQKIAIARRSRAAVAHACHAMCASCGWLRRLANAPGPAKLSEHVVWVPMVLPEPCAKPTTDCAEGKL